MKIEHQRPGGYLHSHDIPQWKWDAIGMDFIVGLPRARSGLDAILVVVDLLTKSAHFLATRASVSAVETAHLFLVEIVRLHGVPRRIISDRDARFMSHFWQAFQKEMGTKLNMSSAYHPKTDGQTERVNQILEDMLRACALQYREGWDRMLPLAEFAYNNSYQESLRAAPYEILYGRPCRTPLCWDTIEDRQQVSTDLVRQTTEQVREIRDRLRAAQDRQAAYANRRRRPLEFAVGDHVFLRVSPLKGLTRFGRKGKLAPRYIGPFQVLQRIGRVAYWIALPPHLAHVHDVFHVSMLRRYVPDEHHVIEKNRDTATV